MLRESGLEPTLESLYEAGVYVTQEEFKGRRPIQRNGLELNVRPADFNNPLLVVKAEAKTSGSRGAQSIVPIDFRFVGDECAHHLLMLATHEVLGQPMASWRPDGNASLVYAKLGVTPEKWFSQNHVKWNSEGRRDTFMVGTTLLAGMLAGKRLPRPEFIPRDDAWKVAAWLAAKVKAGTPAVLVCNAGSAVTVCLAAKDRGLAINGTVFRVGGEPYTEAKASALLAVGARAIVGYGAVDTGTLGHGCVDALDPDDVHVYTDRFALIQRDKSIDGAMASVPALIQTGLLRYGPKLLLNVESGDFGRLEERRCGCLLGRLGLTTHVAEIRSYEKLTSEGVTFLGQEAYRLIEEVLPGRFGGSAADYQIVEEEDAGMPRVSLIVAPGVGPVDEADVVETVLNTLSTDLGGRRLMADQWRQAGTVRVWRREPYATATAKVLPLHVLRPSGHAPNADRDGAT